MKGIRVLEVSHAVAGPTASQILADYGAEVIKIERPGSGDIFRNTPGMGPAMFLAVNRGKKSVALDLKNPKGLKIFYDLVRKCDVIVENLSPGTAEELGITYAKVRRRNSRVIYCKIESFGAGPYESIPAFDPVLQAAVGIMSTTGFPPDKYARAGVSMVDMSAGMHAATAVLDSLLRREKTGKGALIQVSLYDAAAYYMSYWVALYDLYGKDTSPLGSTHIFGAPYNFFKTKDGGVYIAVANDEAWKSMCHALNFNDLFKKSVYKTNACRVENKIGLEREVSKHLASLSSQYILQKLKGSKVPVAKFNTAKTLVKDPHFKARKLAVNYTYLGKAFRTIVSPALIDRSRLHATGNPPELGEHTGVALKEILNLSKKRLALLGSEHVIQIAEKKPA